jgi:hypothetical protein
MNGGITLRLVRTEIVPSVRGGITSALWMVLTSTGNNDHVSMAIALRI